MIQGFVYNKNKNILSWINLKLKNEYYQTFYKTRTNKNLITLVKYKMK